MDQELLETISTMCKVALLNFYDEKEIRLSIKNNALMLEEKTLFQPILRKYFGDSRENVSKLFIYVIQPIITLYLVPQKKEEDRTENDKKCAEIGATNQFRKLVEFMCLGMEKLQDGPYNSGNVIFALQYYINMLKHGLEGTYDPYFVPKKYKDYEVESLVDKDKLKDLWDTKAVNTIYEQFSNCFSCESDRERKAYIESIVSHLRAKDERFYELTLGH